MGVLCIAILSGVVLVSIAFGLMLYCCSRGNNLWKKTTIKRRVVKERAVLGGGGSNHTVIKKRNPTAMIRDYDSTMAGLKASHEEERNFQEQVITEDSEEMEEIEVREAVLDYGGDE